MSDFADTRVSLAGRGQLVGMAASTVSSGSASIKIGDVTVSANVARGLSLAVGDPVLIGRAGSKYYVTNILQASAPSSPEDPEIAPTPKPPTTSGVLVVSPVETRTWRPSSWTQTGNDAVYQGQYGGYGLNTGVAFYGSKPLSLAGATVTSATVAVRRIQAGTYASQTSTLRLVTQRTRPAGAPTLTSSTTGPALAVNSTNNAFTVPTSWAQAMVDGPAGGLAVYDADGSPYMKFAGRGDWSGAWVLKIYWTR